jgi:hypothetical protein
MSVVTHQWDAANGLESFDSGTTLRTPLPFAKRPISPRKSVNSVNFVNFDSDVAARSFSNEAVK